MIAPDHTSTFEFNFNDVTRLSEIDSNEFANLKLEKGILYTLLLNSVTSIDQVECLNIVNFKGSIIELNSLKEISLEIAQILAGFNGALSLGIETINPDVAKILSRHSAALSLTGLKSLSDLELEFLSNYRGNVLELNSLETLTENQAKKIAAY